MFDYGSHNDPGHWLASSGASWSRTHPEQGYGYEGISGHIDLIPLSTATDRPADPDPWLLDIAAHSDSREGRLPWMGAWWPLVLIRNSYPTDLMTDQAPLAASLPQRSSIPPMNRPKTRREPSGVSALNEGQPAYYSPVPDERIWPDSDSEFEFNPEDLQWDVGGADDEGEHLDKGDDSSDYSYNESATQHELQVGASALPSDHMDTDISANKGLTKAQNLRNQMKQRLRILMNRGILRSSVTTALAIPLWYLDKIIKSTSDSVPGQRKYEGYAIHKLPRRSISKAERRAGMYSFLDPKTASKAGMLLKVLLTSESNTPRPARISKRTGATLPSRRSRVGSYGQHLGRLAAAYFTLDDRGVRCTRDVDTRRVKLNWLRDVLERTDPETATGAGEAGKVRTRFVIHNTAPKGEPMAPILLDLGETIGSDDEGETVSLVSGQWINKYRATRGDR